MSPLNRLVWVDLETTGLEVYKNRILELGIIITDGQLNEIAAQSWVMPCDLTWRRWASDFVREMHDKSGLWEECKATNLTVSRVEGLAVAFVREHAPDYNGPIAGTGPHFDKKWLDHDMPALAELFNYRTFDSRTLDQAWCQAHGCPVPDRPAVAAHRALPDLRFAIGNAKAVIDDLIEHGANR